MDKPQTPHAEIVEDDVLDAREALSERLASVWWTFFLRGLLAAGVGLAALFWPTGSISLLLQLVGVVLIVDGGLTLFGLGRRGAAGSIGIGAIIIGLILLIWPEGTARFAFALLGAFALLISGRLLADLEAITGMGPRTHGCTKRRLCRFAYRVVSDFLARVWSRCPRVGHRLWGSRCVRHDVLAGVSF